ncbi:MAG: hypothetical protein N3A01_03135 [Bacteroidales bacterium]|nr:hypothetical protein [Bacteroidales bacterium]
MNDFFKFSSFFSIISKWKLHFILVTIISFILGVIISSPLFITPLYKSSAIVYPVNLYEYSKESTTEQMFQVLLSNDIKFKMLEKFKLDKHYNLNRKDPHFISYFLYEYNDKVKIKKTDYESIEIIVYDKDPKMAYEMVNGIISFYNDKIRELHSTKHKELITITENAIKNKLKHLDTLLIKIKDIQMNKKVLLNSYYIQEVSNKALNGNPEAKQILNNILEYKNYYHLLDTLYELNLAQYKWYLWQLETSKNEANKKITYAQVVSKPFIPDKKAYPIRWLIVVITMSVSLFLFVFIVSFAETNKLKYNKPNNKDYLG